MFCRMSRSGRYQQARNKTRKELPEKQTELKLAEEEYENVKNRTHQFSSDKEAADLARKSIIEMDKTLNALDIELAGIRQRLKAIDNYRNKPAQRDVIYQRLDEMFVEQMIELSGSEARKKVTEQIREKEQNFLRLFNRRKELRNRVGKLSRLIEDSRLRIDDITKLLNDPTPSMLPPKVYQNKATIYPVHVDEQAASLIPQKHP